MSLVQLVHTFVELRSFKRSQKMHLSEARIRYICPTLRLVMLQYFFVLILFASANYPMLNDIPFVLALIDTLMTSKIRILFFLLLYFLGK